MNDFDLEDIDMAWCAGCGNFGIINILKKALTELGLKPQNIVLVSGIGQAAKLPQYIKCNYFNGLHGRSLPVATAIKASNPDMNVIVTSGDGDMYGEGGNHFIHTIRRNPNITVIVHDNMVYGLTKGQASPTSQKGMKTPVQTMGVILEPFNPMAVAISLDASFVARASVNDMAHAREIIKKAILHKGFSLVDIFQPCVTFNKINTYEWYKNNTYYLDKDYDPHDKSKAFAKAIETEKIPLGIIYIKEKPSFEELTGVYETNHDPLFKREFNKKKFLEIIDEKNIKKKDESSKKLVKEKIDNSKIRHTPAGEKYAFDENDNLVLLSADSGITPFIKILRYIREKKLKNKVIMLNYNKSYEDIMYRIELDSLSKENIYIMNTLERYDNRWLGEKGNITKEMILKYVDKNKLNDYTWMLSGPFESISLIEKELENLHIKKII